MAVSLARISSCALSAAVPRTASSSSSLNPAPTTLAFFSRSKSTPLLAPQSNPAAAAAVSWRLASSHPLKKKLQRYGRRPDFRSSALASRAFSAAAAAATTATIKVGDKLPEAELSYLDKDSNVQTVKVSELTEGKKVVLFAVPGAYTPTCSLKHVPGFVEKADELKAKGIDTIACVSVNDVFVLRAWGESLGVGDKVLLLSDGNVGLTKAMGVQMDLSDKPVGLGLRSRRYSLLAENGVVKQINLEEGGAFSISGAEDLLKTL